MYLQKYTDMDWKKTNFNEDSIMNIKNYWEVEKTKLKLGSQPLGEILHSDRKGDIILSQMEMSELCGTYCPLLSVISVL
jgi:hypothetical protein